MKLHYRDPLERSLRKSTGRRFYTFASNVSRNAPWKGRSPVAVAETGATLAAELESALGDEAGGPRGHVLTVPQNPTEGSLSGITDAISQLAGDVFIAEIHRQPIRRRAGSIILFQRSTAEATGRGPARVFSPSLRSCPR